MALTPDRLRELSFPERYFFTHSKLSEVNFQQEDSVRAYTASYALRYLLMKGELQIRGSLPKEGAGLLVANHTGGSDIFLMHLLPIETAGRILYMVAKEKLVNPDAHESEIMQRRRRKKNAVKKVFGILGIDRFVNRHIAAPYARSFHVIPMNTGDESGGMANLKSFREIRQKLADGKLVGVFPTGTRKPPLDLLDTLPLAGKISVNAPDLSVFPAGIYGRTANIGEPITFGQVLEEQKIQGKIPTREAIKIMDRVIADKIADLVPDYGLFPAWWLERNGFFSEQQLRLMYESGVNLGQVFITARNGMKEVK